MRRSIRLVFIAVAVVVLLIAALVTGTVLGDHRLRAFCGELRPGTPIDQISLIAVRNKIDPKSIIDARTFPEAAREQSMLVAAPGSMGETTCDIELGANAVKSARVYGP